MSGRELTKPNPDRQLISEVAMDIGKEMVAYLEMMYPDQYATFNSGTKLSIRNHIHNDIMAALGTIDADEIRARLEKRRKHRRKMLKLWRAIRARPARPPKKPI